MRFCPWYPLDEAGSRTPATPNVLQLRIAIGLRPYPRGKSAMVHYQTARDARASAVALAERWRGQGLWCRHLIELDDASADRLQSYCAKLLGDFVRRFGAEPSFGQTEPGVEGEGSPGPS